MTKRLFVCFAISWLAFVARAGVQPGKVSAPVAVAPSFTRTIYLVRHGAYDDGPAPTTDAGGGLTPLGIAQARLVAARLAGMPVTFNTLTASTLARAMQTAQVVNQSLPQLKLQTTPLLRECTPRTWRTDVTRDETAADMAAAEARLDEAFAKYFVPAVGADQHDILVCHGNVIRYFVTKALGVDTQAWAGLAVAHCSLTVIRVTPRHKFLVLGVGDIGHIPPNLQSGIASTGPQLVVP
jgi:serine/threonine-protein phosphatase PGAM5